MDDQTPIGSDKEDFDEDSQLSQDYDTPFSEPDAQEDKLDPTHPATDAKMDLHELYDEGLAGAAEVDLPDDQPEKSS